MALLTLHTDRLDRLVPSRVHDGHDLAGHWLLQEAVDADVITWDKAVWGHLVLGVEPENRDELHTTDLTSPPAGHDDAGQARPSTWPTGVLPEPREGGSHCAPPPGSPQRDRFRSAPPRREGGHTHNLGGLYADIHHADWHTAPASLPHEVWDRLLTKHRQSELSRDHRSSTHFAASRIWWFRPCA